MRKYAWRTGVAELLRVFQNIMRSETVPMEWGHSLTNPLYKGKRDVLQCLKYRGFRLLGHGMKNWERILYERLKHVTKVDENQFGFMAGKSKTGAIFIIRQLHEKYLEKKKKLYQIFVDLEKAFDKVPRPAIGWALHRQVVPESLIDLVMALYSEIRSLVRVAGETSDSFEIGVEVFQGSVLSPLLFILVMEEATIQCRVGGLWKLLYPDDLARTSETLGNVELMFGEWRQAMERRWFKVNLEKAKMMVTGRKMEDVLQVGRYPCGVYGRSVGANSVPCRTCGKWCHRRCSGLRSVSAAAVAHFQCPAFARGGGGGCCCRESGCLSEQARSPEEKQTVSRGMPQV